MSHAALAQVLDEVLAACAPRAGSLAVTIFGDSISQHGNSVWLGSLIAAMELFGLNARQIRTAVFRLGQEGWLTATQRGRRSFYRYTEFGQRQYAHAAERIYAARAAPWDGNWTLVTPVAIGAAVRDELKRRLGWQGFGSLGGGLLAHPRAPAAPLQETLSELGVRERVVVWRASAGEAAAVAELVGTVWRLDEVAARFSAFHAAFSRLLPLVDAQPPPADAFRLRTLLIHEYRRILLSTTELPPALLKANWPGHAARELTTRLYRATHGAAVRFCREEMHNQDGPLPAPQVAYFTRFGGLDMTAMGRAASAA